MTQETLGDKMKNLIAFIEQHDSKVVSHTETTITATVVVVHADGHVTTEEETFPATLQAARDFLGY